MTDLDPEARRLLELARDARTPGAHDKARVAAALGLSLTAAPAGAAPEATGGASAAKSVAGVSSVKWWFGGAAVLAAAVGSYLLASSSAPQHTRRAAKPAVRALVTRAAPSPEAPPAPSLAVQAPTAPEQPQHGARRAERHRAGTGADTLAAELDLLHRAQTAWRAREAAGALALLDEHRVRYPHSALGLERDGLRVLTLCELGRADEATRLARSVLARAPNSPLRASLEQSCALKSAKPTQ
jgi:hypothetical protein